MKTNTKDKTLINNLPLQLTFQMASELSSIPIWTLRKYERAGKMPRGRRIGSRVYISTRKFLEWLEVSDSDN